MSLPRPFHILFHTFHSPFHTPFHTREPILSAPCRANAFRYVEEALAEYSATADRKLGNDMLARAAGPHIEVIACLSTDCILER